MMQSIKQRLWHQCGFDAVIKKNNSTGVLIVQTVILLAVLAILIVVLVELVKSRKRNEADAYLRKQAVARLFAENIALLKIRLKQWLVIMDIKRNRENGATWQQLAAHFTVYHIHFRNNPVVCLKQCIVFYSHLLSLKSK